MQLFLQCSLRLGRGSNHSVFNNAMFRHVNSKVFPNSFRLKMSVTLKAELKNDVDT